jgi:hypothetical protein
MISKENYLNEVNKQKDIILFYILFESKNSNVTTIDIREIILKKKNIIFSH